MSRFSRPPPKPSAPPLLNTSAPLYPSAHASEPATHAEPCAHCVPLLLELQEIARMLRLQLPHDGAVKPSTGRCAAQSCWCATV